MIKLKELFESNFDKTGVQTFEQIRREWNESGEKEYVIYKRTKQNGSVHGYEVFEIKMRLKGQPLPGGAFEENDRECYPGAHAFGKYAWDFKFEQSAYTAFENLLKTGHPFKPLKRPELVVDSYTSDFQLPDVSFTIDELVEKSGENKQNVYLKLQQLIKNNIVSVVGESRISGQRGRAKKVYCKI
jgi:hypothetical protein